MNPTIHTPAVEAIVRWNEGRKPDLVRRKYERMAADVFAFFRGTDHLFASGWPDPKPGDAGPPILVCGDLHLENFGVYRAEDGDFVFDLNDFDDALVGPCSLDLVRCSTSVLLASEDWGLSPIQATRALLGFLDRYRKTVAESVEGGPTPWPTAPAVAPGPGSTPPSMGGSGRGSRPARPPRTGYASSTAPTSAASSPPSSASSWASRPSTTRSAA